jgi:hypothetical protein
MLKSDASKAKEAADIKRAREILLGVRLQLSRNVR